VRGTWLFLVALRRKRLRACDQLLRLRSGFRLRAPAALTPANRLNFGRVEVIWLQTLPRAHEHPTTRKSPRVLGTPRPGLCSFARFAGWSPEGTTVHSPGRKSREVWGKNVRRPVGTARSPIAHPMKTALRLRSGRATGGAFGGQFFCAPFLLRSAASVCAHAFGRVEVIWLQTLPRAYARGYFLSPAARAGVPQGRHISSLRRKSWVGVQFDCSSPVGTARPHIAHPTKTVLRLRSGQATGGAPGAQLPNRTGVRRCDILRQSPNFPRSALTETRRHKAVSWFSVKWRSDVLR
jgi:hypothetical protein